MTGTATATLADFFAVLHPLDSRGYSDLRAITGNRIESRFVKAGDIEAAERFITEFAGANLYVGVATRKSRSSGKLENCGTLYVLFTEIDFKDISEAEARVLIERFPYKPSIIIHSGGGLHIYWLLREPLDLQDSQDCRQAYSLLRRLAPALGGDPASAEPARILRIPGTLNHKPEYGTPRPVLIEAFNPERAYNPSDFDDVLPAEPEPSNGNGRGFTVGDKIKDGERNTTLYKLARSMKAKGLSDAAILAALRAENQAKCEPPLSDAEIEKIAGNAFKQPDRPEFAATDGADRQASATPEPPWPTLAPEALHGLAGEVVAAIDPSTEADKVAVLVQFLTMFGCVIGRALHFLVEWTRHPAKLFIILVGDTSKGRKGTSQSTLRRIFGAVDPAFTADRASRMKSGLSSGEGLIWHVRDPVYDTKKNRETGEDEEVMTDKGEADKRLLITESEFAQALKVMAREGNTLSTVIRQAFDDEPLTPLTKNNRITATGSHIAIVGHITKGELLRYLSETEMANGFCNRFIFLVVRRSKCLSNPKGLPVEQIDLLARRLRDRFEQAHKSADAGPLQRDDEAERLWAEVYPSLSDGKPGLTGAILGRGECHVMRLALTYALLDGASCIQTPHLLAALALWEYAEASARYIFGEVTGDAVADRIVEALKNRGETSESDILHKLFQGNVKAERIRSALNLLHRAKRITLRTEETAGRTKTLWRATT